MGKIGSWQNESGIIYGQTGGAEAIGAVRILILWGGKKSLALKWWNFFQIIVILVQIFFKKFKMPIFGIFEILCIYIDFFRDDPS